MVAWEGHGTKLPRGFAGLRIGGASRLQLQAEEWLPHEPEEGGRSALEPAQLLCRALRLAPACCRWFELAAAKPEAPLMLMAITSLRWDDKRASGMRMKSFPNIAELCAALRRFAAAEGLEVCAAPGEASILMRRAGAGRDDAQQAA